MSPRSQHQLTKIAQLSTKCIIKRPLGHSAETDLLRPVPVWRPLKQHLRESASVLKGASRKELHPQQNCVKACQLSGSLSAFTKHFSNNFDFLLLCSKKATCQLFTNRIRLAIFAATRTRATSHSVGTMLWKDIHVRMQLTPRKTALVWLISCSLVLLQTGHKIITFCPWFPSSKLGEDTNCPLYPS